MTTLSPEALKKFLEGPSTIAPPGVVQNLDNPPNWNSEALAVAILCIILTTVAVAARLYSRLVITKKLRIEDYIGLITLLPYYGVAWCIFDFRIQAGFFVHQWDLRGYVLIKLGINAFVVGMVYCLVMLLLKTAILLEWNRIFVLNHTNNTFYWISTILMVSNIGLYFSAIFADIFGCVPVQKSWHFWLAGKCVDRKARDVFNASFNLIIDVFIFILPQRIIWKLQMTGSRKVGVSIVFSVGLLVIATAVGRLYSTVTLDYVSDAKKPTDRTYKFSATLLWALAEITCIFFVFCVPAFPKLFADHGIVSQIAASLRTWTRLGPRSSSSSRQSRNASWPRTIGHASSKPRGSARTYRLDDEEEHMQYSLSELTAPQNEHDHFTGSEDSRREEPDILKTVQVYQQDEAASKTSVTPIIKKQHP